MPTPVGKMVKKHRGAMRAAGLHPGFEEECRRQSRVVAASDAEDCDLDAFMEAVLAEDRHDVGDRRNK